MGCVACQTIHHLDCWVYLGGCATYACGSRRAEGPAGSEQRLAEVLAALDVPRHDPVSPRSAGCASCKRRWRGEKGVACRRCGATYHPACWVANAGCLKKKCRGPGFSRGGGLPGLRGLVSGLGKGNCPVCIEPPPPGERILCSGCMRPYHAGCWKANAGCVRAKCRAEGPASDLVPAPGAGAKVPPMRGPSREVRPFTRQELRLGARLTAGIVTLAFLLLWLFGHL